MAQDRIGSPPPERIAVVRALRGLGDMLCTVPALRALRASLPRARITLVGLPAARVLQERFAHYLDDLLEFPGFPGIPEVAADPARLPEFFANVQGRFDLALQMHGSGTHSNPFTILLGARDAAGFYLPSLWCPDPDRFTAYPAHLNEVRRWLALMEFLGIPPAGESLEFPVTAADEERLGSAWPERRDGRYVCVHPGATDRERMWPTERFAAVADALAAEGLVPVLTGTEGEKEITAAVVRSMRSKAVDLAGRTDLGALAALVRDAELVVCNDTGVSHLAAALSTPSVIIFSASDPERWAPLDLELHRAVGEVMPERANSCRHTADVDGHRCLRDGCSSLMIEGRASWSPAGIDEALGQARELLGAARTG
ncbi:MAG: glycosyltransferase family 9 protein [Trueperaceae bacterium]